MSGGSYLQRFAAVTSETIKKSAHAVTIIIRKDPTVFLPLVFWLLTITAVTLSLAAVTERKNLLLS